MMHRHDASAAPPGSSTAGRAAAPRAGRRHFAACRRASAIWPFAALAVLAVSSASSPALAQAGGGAERDESGLAGDGKAPKRCVIVEIAGHRSGHLDCASQRLQDAARIARDQARRTIEVPQTGSPDVTVGVSSLSGTRLRMGNALGHSVHPQRPGQSFAAPRLGRPQ
jgi:hypothetical protein